MIAAAAAPAKTRERIEQLALKGAEQLSEILGYRGLYPPPEHEEQETTSKRRKK